MHYQSTTWGVCTMSTAVTTTLTELPIWALLSLSALVGAVSAAAGALAFNHIRAMRRNGLGGGDSVTGAASRREFVAQLDAVWEEERRLGPDFGLLVVDINRFADINQLYGRQVGDKVLREVAERIRLRVRAGDSLGRIDADEFAVICRGVSPSELESVRLELEALASLSDPVPVHLSVGVAAPERHDSDSIATLNRARASMRSRRELLPARNIDQALHELISSR